MMKKICILIFLAWAAVGSSWAQSTSTGTPYYVDLQTGERVYARRIQFKSPLFKGNYFLLDDSLKYAPEMVKSYQTPEGYFARISGGKRSSDFAQRQSTGRISTYFTYRTDYSNMYPGMGIGYGGYRYGGLGYGMPTQRRVYYFSKDNSELQPLNYQNLRVAVSDNAGSMAVLQKYKQGKVTQTVMYIAGAALMIGGLTQSSGNGISPLVYVGAGVSILPALLQFTRKDRLSEAIELYNYSAR